MKNVVLIGFMGTGKTSTGKMLASKLGCAFIDMDVRIEEEQHKPIPQIFAEEGEAHFRALERDLVQRLAKRQNAVISTGGGTVKNSDNIADFKRTGTVIALTATVDTIFERTSTRGERPVLDKEDKGDRRRAIESLLKERQGLYDQADFSVDTSNRSPLQVVDVIIRYLKARGALHA